MFRFALLTLLFTSTISVAEITQKQEEKIIQLYACHQLFKFIETTAEEGMQKSATQKAGEQFLIFARAELMETGEHDQLEQRINHYQGLGETAFHQRMSQMKDEESGNKVFKEFANTCTSALIQQILN